MKTPLKQSTEKRGQTGEGAADSQSNGQKKMSNISVRNMRKFLDRCYIICIERFKYHFLVSVDLPRSLCVCYRRRRKMLAVRRASDIKRVKILDHAHFPLKPRPFCVHDALYWAKHSNEEMNGKSIRTDFIAAYSWRFIRHLIDKPMKAWLVLIP